MRFVSFVVLSALFAASSANAGVSPTRSTFPSHVNYAGWNGIASDPAGTFTVVVRDDGGNPVAGCPVTLDFPPLDIRVAAWQPDPILVTSCADRTITLKTDAAGRVSVAVVGGGKAGFGSTGPLWATLSAGGIPLGPVSCSVFDLDGVGGVGANDLSLWLTDNGRGRHPGRCDYDGDGWVTANDLSLLIGVIGGGGSTWSAASYCP